jgi:hypothetical protein
MMSPASAKFVSRVYMRQVRASENSISFRDIRLAPSHEPDSNQCLYSGRISFYMSFHNWVDAKSPFSTIHQRLLEQADAVTRIESWVKQGVSKIRQRDSWPSLFYFDVSPTIFKEVVNHPAISFTFDPESIHIVHQQGVLE